MASIAEHAAATNPAAENNDLEQLKTTLLLAQGKARRLETPKEELRQLCEAVKHAIATNRMATDADFRKFVHSDLSIGIMQKLAKTMSYDQEYIEIVADIIQAHLDLFAEELKAGRYNEQFTCAMTWAFQPECNFHRKNFQMSEDDLKRLTTSRQKWRENLKVGDQLDANCWSDDKQKSKGWLQCRIERIDGDILSLVFPELPADFDGDFDRWSTDLAEFETKTKEDYAWRRENLEKPDLKDFILDMHDKFKWEEGTIFDIAEKTDSGRPVWEANCGFRVYRTNGKKAREDEKGIYDGWSNKFDEYIPIYSPRLQKHLSRVNGADLVFEENDDDDEEALDDIMTPVEGQSRIYCVPRISSCISSKFISFMNRFGNNGGFDAILSTLQNKAPDAECTLTAMGYMITMISMPVKLFMRDWMQENGPLLTQAIVKQLLNSPDNILKHVPAGDVNQIKSSVNSINVRHMDRELAREEHEKFHLEICKKCLASELLERRILGIKELNQVVRNASMTYSTAKSLSMPQLITWMRDHEVFDILWDTKKTHLQLVQRSNEIFKALPKEDLLSMELLEQFWSLSKTDYKSEVFKIINESAFHLKQNHIEYLFDQITETPASKLGMEEFDALSGLGKFSSSPEFTAKTSNFFWNIITDSDEHKADLIENCIGKFAEMIKFQSMEKKQSYFDKLVHQLQSGRSSAVPVIRLFKKIIKDQKQKASYSSSSYAGASTTTVGGTTVVNHGASTTADGKTIYSKTYNGASAPQESIYQNAGAAQEADSETQAVKEVTLKSCLNDLINNHGLVEALMGNLSSYCQVASQKVIGQPSLAAEENREKLFFMSAKHSHHDEVNERLSFLQEFAVNSDFKISKAQLKVIYDLLMQSPIKSDFPEFLTWCNNACQAQTAMTSVMDLEEVGEFFSELISTKTLNLALLPVVGFEFLTAYFTSQNLEQGKLLKIAPPQKKKSTNSGWTGGYYSTYKKEEEEETQQDDDPTFKILVVPAELTKIDMIWDIALQAQQSQVINKSIAFLVNCYISVDDELESRRSEMLQSLNARCFELIAENKSDPAIVKRLAQVLEVVIQISEKQGTGGVHPHNAMLKGEMLDRIIVRYMVKNKQSYYGGLKLDRTLIFKVYTSATVWELKKEVASRLGLSTKYIKLTLPNKEVIKESQHGQTLLELNFKNGDSMTAQKLSIVENIVEVPLADRVKGQLVPRAREIFTEWFDLYKNKEEGKMDAQCTATFISGATKASCLKDDNRVNYIMDKYDTDKDGWIDLEGFLQFYYDAITGSTLKAVQNNLKNHNVRLDLKKMSEVVEEQSFAKHEMPRYTLSANQDQFQALIDLLDRNDEATSSVWDLVRMLATNQKMYQEVLSLSEGQNNDSTIDWGKVFEDKSLYKQIYKQEIIVAVMEASNLGAESQRIMFVEELQIASSYSAYNQQAAGADDDDEEEKKMEEADGDKTADTDASEASESARIEGLKANWTKLFLEQKGFNYIFSSILSKNVSANACVTFNEQAAQIDTAFLMTLLRVFLKAGFQAQDAGIGKAIGLVRKSSSIGDEDSLTNQKDQAREDKLVALMTSPEGQEIILDTKFDALLDKMLEILTVTVSKSSLILEDKMIIENALSIVVGILMYDKTLYSRFVNFTNAASPINSTEQLILQGLLSDEDKVRSDFLQSLSVIATNLREKENNALYLMLGILANNFSIISNKPSRQFFELFNKMIDLKAMRDNILGDDAEDSSNIYNPEALLNQIIDKIKQQQKPKTEAEPTSEADAEDEVKAMELAAEQERLLVGLVTLTGKIIAKADKAVSDKIITEKDLIGQIFREFLFASYYQAQMENNQSDTVMIQQKSGSRVDTKKQTAPNNQSREAAYELLHQLIKNSTTLMDKFLEDQLVPLISTIKKPKTWSYTPQTSSQREQVYVGLRNLGCICYMNSMMQQFFMVPALRYNLLCINDGVAENMQEYKGDQIDDNMMHQMQKLLAHLELSERSEYNPKEFCFAFKEFDGAPTNTAEQKDAQEFLNLIFDRLENALKPTSRKHLVQSIFGGKQCSQMVCTECGKVKNRIEDYLNLSLPIKGMKSIEESLAKQVEGEIINDYQCDGCNRKVDLQKRTMIASTPNVLIVHLQRICFNFDTFQNDKINSFCEFPNVLDLKPYSFHEVMGKENRLKEQQEQEEEVVGSMKKNDEDEMTEEELAKKKELEAEAAEPERDDCYEYKLVGVNVHSGTANAGHYWSYINTNRGTDEKEGDQSWIKTEADTWMEFNDSRVSDWQFSELRQRTFGNEQKATTTNTYFSSMGDSYGTSAYMLFYERRVKRDMKIIVEEEKVEETKAMGVNVEFDEEKKEHYKMSAYRNAADGEAANDIYTKVFDDNMKFTFESDIYSTEFFDFILQILQSVAETPVSESTKLHGLQIGTKVGFEILARMMINPGIEKVSQVMIDILKSQPQITKPFIEKMCSFAESEVLWEVLLECNDKNAQKHLSRVVKYALCQLKMEEKELALSQAMDTHTEKVTQQDGTEVQQEIQVPKAVCVRFMFNMVKLLQERAPKNWRKFDSFIDIFQALMVHSAEEIATDNTQVDKESDAFKTGVELYYIYDMLRYLGDFILQENSPYQEPGQIRTSMGGAYQSPNFGPILKTIIYMISDQELMAKYPLNELNQAIVSHKDILQKMVEPGEGSKEDFTEILTGMAKNNRKISKKMAKAYLKSCSKTSLESISKALNQVRQFLKIDDDLKKERMEWIFGVPQILTKQNFRTKQQQYGLEVLDLISDDYIQFKCANVKGVVDAFLGSLYKSKNRMDTQCVFGLRILCEMCIEDDEVAEYVFNQPSPNLQYARYTDWWFTYTEALRDSTLNQTKGTTMLEYHKNRLIALEAILSMKEKLEAKFSAMFEEQKKKLAAMDDSTFAGYKEMTLWPQVPEVIPSYPPNYIIGQVESDASRVLVSEDTEMALVTVEEVSCEYMYSNPDGMFNLSIPEKMYRNSTNYQNQSYQSWKIAQLKAKAAEGETVTADQIVFKNWLSDRAIGSTLLKVMIKNKASRMMRISLKLSVADDEEKNVVFPITDLKENLFSNDTKQAYIFTKIDPSKESWGKISLTVNVKAGKTTQINSSSNYNNATIYSTQTGYYQSSGTSNSTGMSTQTNYKPVGADDSDSQVKCVNCDALCYAGEDYCAKCGKSTTEYDPSDL